MKPYSTSQYPITRKKYQLLPPPPHEPSQKFLSPDPGKSLHPSPENIATPPKHFKQSKKNLSPLTQTHHSKEMLSVRRIPPPPPQKKKKPTSQPLEKTEL